MSPDRTEIYRFRTGYLKFKAVLCDRNTGLLSYRVYFDEVRRFFESRSTVAVMVAEIAELPRIESIYGWQVCDDLLVRGADTCRRVVASRWGQDAVVAQDGVYQGRFVIFVPESTAGAPLDAATTGEWAAEIRQQMQAAFAGPEYDDMTPGITIAVGATLLRENPFLRFERQMTDAVQDAVPAARENDGERMVMEHALRTIIADERVAVLFQPVVDLVSDEVVGYEALSRGPGGTDLEPPAVLFSHGDRLGLSGPLDRVCHKRACEASAGLGENALLFLNTVPDALGGDIEGHLPPLLANAGRAPDGVVLEVAEHRLQDRPRHLARDLASARALGFRLALDNAGTGYSTLKLIEDLKPSYIKIDPTLVRGIDGNLLQQEVARSVVSAAERLDCQVVAPGIESGAEAETVRQCGVRLAQGNHLAPPRPARRARLAEPGSYGGKSGP